MTDKKTVNIPQTKVIMLTNNQQVIAGVTVEDGSDFVRLHEAYKIRVHENTVDDQTYFVEERMSLTPWMFQTTDKVHSVHKNHIMTIGKPNDNLTDYYNNVRMGLFPSMKKELKPLPSAQDTIKDFADVMEDMTDEDYYQTIQYLKGKIKPN